MTGRTAPEAEGSLLEAGREGCLATAGVAPRSFTCIVHVVVGRRPILSGSVRSRCAAHTSAARMSSKVTLGLLSSLATSTPWRDLLKSDNDPCTIISMPCPSTSTDTSLSPGRTSLDSAAAPPGNSLSTVKTWRRPSSGYPLKGKNICRLATFQLIPSPWSTQRDTSRNGPALGRTIAHIAWPLAEPSSSLQRTSSSTEEKHLSQRTF
mmetsp:Transcript_55142/g.130886  ORF Transcript_55142/g.130886 Transcript_55142/m.130886 type:complete len:208 (-) Transcript_55142:34-657(-)